MSDEQLLAGHVDTWWRSIEDLLTVLEGLSPEEWDLPTDLPGWDVRAVVSHTAHLESVLATGVEEHAEVGDAPHVVSPMGQYTEIGVVNRRDATPADLLAEIRSATRRRHETLLAAMPTDASAPADPVFGGMPWDWGTLLRNRPLDVWMHEQDVRRAVGRPGGTDSPGAAHTVAQLGSTIGYVLGKRVGAAPGTSVVLEVVGHGSFAVEVGDDGRARPVTAPPTDPTVRLRMDAATLAVLAGGRRGPDRAEVVVDGDPDLAAAILARMGTMP